MELQKVSCIMIITCIILKYHNKLEHTTECTSITVANSAEITANDKNLSTKEMSNCPGYYTSMGLGLDKVNDWIKMTKNCVNSNKLITSYSYLLQTHNRFSILQSICECNDRMQCHNCALTIEGTTLQSTVCTKIIMITAQTMAKVFQSSNIYKTKWDMSPMSNAK